MYKFISILFVISLSVPFAFAEVEAPRLGVPVFEGNGCRTGSVGFAITPNEQVLSVLFDDFKAEAGNGTLVDNKVCNALIPIHIPNGYHLRLFQVDYRGFNALPKGAVGELSTEYEFQGTVTEREKHFKPFKGPLEGEFYESSMKPIKSPCGGLRVLNLRTTLVVRTNPKQDRAFSQVDTKDVTTPSGKRADRKFKYRMVLKQCEKEKKNSPHGTHPTFASEQLE